MTRAQVARLASGPTYARHIGGELPLDRWISFAVKVLRDAGIETYESCQGGRGHALPDPTVRFHGTREAGLRAVAAAQEFGLPVYAIRRCWQIVEGDMAGPYWEIVFHPRHHLMARQRAAERAGMLEAPKSPGPPPPESP